VDDARDGERLALIEFVRLDPKEREAAYQANEMTIPEALKKHPITEAYLLGDVGGGPPKSKIEKLISGARDGDFNNTNMTPAFFRESKNYEKDLKKKGKETVDATREGERLAFLEFIHLSADKQEAAYEADAMDLPESLKGKPITEAFLNDKGQVMVQSIVNERCGRCHDNQQAPNFPNFAALKPLITPPPPRPPAIKVRSIINDRCGRCHNENQAPQFPDYLKLEPFITKPDLEKREALGQVWVGSSSTMGTTKLVQSTHAHALSFAVLFALTGFTFAFSSYGGFVRCVLAPLALVAQVADVSCWWLARLDLPYGPAFALAIMGTGGLVGLGLALQIVLSLFDMFDRKGKLLLLLLLLLMGGVVSAVCMTVIKTGLENEVKRTLKLDGDKKSEEPTEPKPDEKKDPQQGRGVRQPPL
jgi:hypothetical protein